jgi:hypothetical protein
VDLSGIGERTHWAWTIVAPDQIGTQALVVRVYLGNNNDKPTWVRSLEIEVVEFTPTPPPLPIIPPPPAPVLPTPTPVPFLDRPVGITVTWILGVVLIAAPVFVGVLILTGHPLSKFIPLSEEAGVKTEIKVLQRRLQKLREQKAMQGTTVDPKILMEIEDIEAEIQRLKTGLFT